MADNVEFPGPDEPHPAPPPEGDLPADFFDDAAEPSPLSGPGEPEAGGPASAEMTGWEPASAEEAAPVPTPAPRTEKPDHDDAPAGAPVFPVALGLILVAVLIVAVFVSKMTQPAPAAAASETTPAPASQPPAPAPAALAGNIEDLKGRVDGLAAEVKGLKDKVEGLPAPQPPTDLTPVKNRLDELSKSVASLDALPKKVDSLDTKLADLDGAVKSAREATDDLSDKVKKATDSAAAASAAVAKLEAASKPAPAAEAGEAPKPEPDATATAMNQGVELFKSGKYKEAGEIFKKLEADDPKDARVYYYAALTNGLTTGDWQNETLKIAAKGAELEKSGATKPAEVDAAFADLPATLKPWLAFFRKAARP